MKTLIKIETNCFFLGAAILTILWPLSIFNGPEKILFNLPLFVLVLMLGVSVFSCAGLVYFLSKIVETVLVKMT